MSSKQMTFDPLIEAASKKSSSTYVWNHAYFACYCFVGSAREFFLVNEKVASAAGIVLEAAACFREVFLCHVGAFSGARNVQEIQRFITEHRGKCFSGHFAMSGKSICRLVFREGRGTWPARTFWHGIQLIELEVWDLLARILC
jgi:hypothetical protein